MRTEGAIGCYTSPPASLAANAASGCASPSTGPGDTNWLSRSPASPHLLGRDTDWPPTEAPEQPAAAGRPTTHAPNTFHGKRHDHRSPQRPLPPY
jgi:hypothetical protein